MLCAMRQIGIPARHHKVGFAAGSQLQFAFQQIEKPLRRRGSQRTSRLKLGGHLRKLRTQLWRNVDDEVHAIRAGKRRADECIRRVQQVILLQAASS